MKEGNPTRATPATRQPPRVPLAGNPVEVAQTSDALPKAHDARISRRSIMFGLLGAGIAASLPILPQLFGRSQLPEPPGQVVGPEYLAATLAAQAAPTQSMPSNIRDWSGCVSGSGEGQTGLDLVIVVDTTSSMGCVLADVKRNIKQLLETLAAGATPVRVGLVAYRDRADSYVVKSLPLTELSGQGMLALNGFVSALQAAGGADWPEKLDAGLAAAIDMSWRGDAPSAIVIVADAPPHREDEAASFAMAQAFASKIPGARVSVVDTGSGAHAFMRALPREGAGRYVTYDGDILKSLYPAIAGCPGD